MTREAFCASITVSRETAERLEAYIALLEKWNKTINLVSQNSLIDPWKRHILDSAQLLPHVPNKSDCIVDLGSGAGLPGIVLALLLPKAEIHLIESDQRKAAFHREAVRLLKCKASIHAERIECSIRNIKDINVITARALAPLPRLVKLIRPILNDKKVCIFHKTKGINKEIEQLMPGIVQSVKIVDSISDSRGKILVLEVKESEYS